MRIRKNKNTPGNGVRRAVTAVILAAIAATAAFIWINSFDKAVVSNAKSQSIADAVQPIVDPDQKISKVNFLEYLRKSAHFTEFALLGAEIALLRTAARRPRVFTALFLLLSTAVIDESIQMFSDRTDSVKDILIDFSGALAGMAVTAGLCLIISRIARKK